MKIEIKVARYCPCNGNDGFCQITVKGTGDLISCHGENIPDNCPAREGLEITINAN